MKFVVTIVVDEAIVRKGFTEVADVVEFVSRCLQPIVFQGKVIQTPVDSITIAKAQS